jgi:single-stranded-DNA-specific exonuclease
VIEPLYRWRLAEPAPTDPAGLDVARERGLSDRLVALLAARGVTSPDELASFLGPAEDGLHDPMLLPDAEAALRRVAQARDRAERILVYGDFDADGLTASAIVVLALRRLGLDAEAHVPERIADGHGLSRRAIERAVAERRTLIVTADCGTSSGPEIDAARELGIETLVTDHHHATRIPQGAVAVVNPFRSDSDYPERRLTGAGVAWKLAQLLLGRLEEPGHPAALPEPVRELSDLALIGTVADVAPLVGENRCLARLGLERLREQPRPGLAALMKCGGIVPARLDVEDIAFGLAPRLNAAGRVGEAARAFELLMAEDPEAAESRANEIDAANRDRRALTRTVLGEVRRSLGLESRGPTDGDRDDQADGQMPLDLAAAADLPPAILVRGEWPVGIIGLVAGKLAEELNRPVVVATSLGPGGMPPANAESGAELDAVGLATAAQPVTLRGSCRTGGGLDLARTLVACEELLIRHGGHEAAAGFDISAERWPEFAARFLEVARAGLGPASMPELEVEMVLPADRVDFAFVREMALLEPTGPGNLTPVVAVCNLRVARVKQVNGGHTQLVLRRSRDVVDAIAFRRPDLAASLREGDSVDVVARAASRSFGGLETVQLEVLDVAPAGACRSLRLGPSSLPSDRRLG